MNSVHEQLSKTVTQNSTLSQNWVGCTRCTPYGPWLRTHCVHDAVSWHALGCIVAHMASCRRPLLVTIQKNCIVTQLLLRALCDVSRSRTAVVHVVSQCAAAVSQPYCDVSRPKVAPSATLQKFLSRHSPWPGHARAHCRTPRAQAGRIVACVVAVLWPYRRPCCAPARPCHGPPSCAQASLSALCHNTIHCIVTQMGSSPSAAF